MPILKLILKTYDEFIKRTNNKQNANDIKPQKQLCNNTNSNSMCVSSVTTFAYKTSTLDINNIRESNRTSKHSSNHCTSSIHNRTNTTHVDDPSLKVFNIKLHIAKELELRPDILNLYSIDKDNKLCQLNDNDNYVLDAHNNINIPYVKDNNKYIRSLSNNLLPSTNHNEHIHELYYKISNERNKVVVNVYHNGVDKIIFYLSPFCSIYMLKHYIAQKLLSINNTNNNDFNIQNTVIYGNGFEEREYDVFNLGNTSILFKDSFMISDIINYYVDKAMHENNSLSFSALTRSKTLNLLLFIKHQNKPSLGLDFKFNTFKRFTKIAFDDNAPSFREAFDGLNYIIYCYNKQCRLYNDYFFYNKGYGLFNVLETINEIECPKCKKKIILLRSIGFINSKWNYKGLLKQKLQSKFEGDGSTFENNKLFVLPEIDFEKQYLSLLIQVKAFKNKDVVSNDKKSSSSFVNSSQIIIPDEDNEEDSQTISESKLDEINLIESNMNSNNCNNNNVIINKNTNNSNQPLFASQKMSDISSAYSDGNQYNKKGMACDIVILNLNECKNNKALSNTHSFPFVESKTTVFHDGSGISNKNDNIKIDGNKLTVCDCNICGIDSKVKLKTCIVF